MLKQNVFYVCIEIDTSNISCRKRAKINIFFYVVYIVRQYQKAGAYEKCIIFNMKIVYLREKGGKFYVYGITHNGQ